jgi:uncharacterized protein
MKNILIIIIGTSLLCCQLKETKTIEKFVFDDENILSDKEEKELNTLFKEHEKKTSNEIVLHTTSSYGDKENILIYSTDYANEKGIGKKEKDNGVVIVFSKAFREVRINTGYGTEKVLKDDLAKKIIDSLMVPQFKEQKIFEGLRSGSKEIVRFLELPENIIK